MFFPILLGSLKVGLSLSWCHIFSLSIQFLKSQYLVGWPDRVCGEAWICLWCSSEWGGLKWWGNFRGNNWKFYGSMLFCCSSLKHLFCFSRSIAKLWNLLFLLFSNVLKQHALLMGKQVNGFIWWFNIEKLMGFLRTLA